MMNFFSLFGHRPDLGLHFKGLVVLGDGAYDGDDDEIHRIWESFQTKVVSLGKQQPAFEDDVGDECESEDVTFSKQLKKVRFASQDNLVQVYVIEEEGEEEVCTYSLFKQRVGGASLFLNLDKIYKV
jgi:hypothetical protein